ncbi:xanthine dehydrogenase family protein molybdopterin-binding subunit [Bradyrhizobium prioriisuperbiae]|uniref:xanthine dehydrogenase family protein molybdopterin-binding subunit n=1 Tax=Bradyrhizobium prioriisuperbiae TaxID=2854389 RepID=UPI0028EB59E5|nr:xanthine dehydrogenase family protein molybdopterin-binding subunit [Bradyrhizobium prioritasuperba]
MANQGIGARVPRKEDARLMHGRGQYVSDIILPGQSEVAFLRSPVAHAVLRGVTKPQGFESAVFVGGDLTGVNAIAAPCTVPSYKVSIQHPLAQGKVRFAGELIAMTIAPSRAAAEDLAEKIELDLEELPPLVDAHATRTTTETRVHEEWDDNLFLTLNYDNGFEEHAQNAPVVIEREMTMSRQAMVPLEGKAIVADWDFRAEQLTVYTSTQVPHVIRIGLAQCLGLDEGQIRVIAPDVGGGFGYKCVLQPEEICVAWLALTYKRPFRYIEDRREHLIAGANSRQHHYKLKAYADKRGRLLALDAEVTIDGGAYSNWPFTVALEPGQATGNLPGPYDIRGYRCKTYCVATNKPGFLPYRGVARTSVCFAIELLMDAIAREVGREPWEVRMENLVTAQAMPYTNVARKHYDSGDYPRSLETVRREIDLDTWRARQRQGETDGRRIGIGFASYCEQSAHGTSVFAAWGLPLIPGYDQATVRMLVDGSLEVRVGVHSHGQGMETTLAQIANEILGVDVANIRVIHGDTGATPFSTGTYASRSIVMTGGAVAKTCEALVPRLLAIGAHLMQCATNTVSYMPGRVVGPQSSVTIKEIAEAWYRRPQLLPPDVDVNGLEATIGYKPQVDTGAFSYASHAAVVAVDTELGAIEILDYVIAEDCGRMVNPMVVDGQTIGGAAQGIGTALYEESPYDANGQPLASTFMDYLLPGATEVPKFRIHHTETLSPYTAFGIKGMGEGGAIAPPAVLFNAVNDALRDLGVEVSETPLTPRRLLTAIERGSARQPLPAEAQS